MDIGKEEDSIIVVPEPATAPSTPAPVTAPEKELVPA